MKYACGKPPRSILSGSIYLLATFNGVNIAHGLSTQPTTIHTYSYILYAICSHEFLSSFEPELGYIAAKIRFKVDHPYEHSKIIKLNAAKLELDLIYLFPMQDHTKIEFRGNSLDTEYFIIKSVDLLLVLANEFDLRRRQMPNLLANDMKVRLPRRKENVQLIPMLRRESPVHRGRDVDNLVGLIDFGAHKLCLQN